MPTLKPLPKFDDVRVVAAHGVSTIEIDPEQPDKDLANLKDLFDGAIAARRAFDDQFNGIVASPHFTADGKRERVRELAEKVLNGLRGDNLISVAARHHAELADSIKFKPATLDARQFEAPAAAALAGGRFAALAVRERELRDWLFTQDDLARQLAFNKAVDTRDELLFGAFVNAPAPMRDALLSPDALKQGLQQWETNGSPEAAAKVTALGRAIKLAKDARRNLALHVRSVAGLPEALEPVVLGRG